MPDRPVTRRDVLRLAATCGAVGAAAGTLLSASGDKGETRSPPDAREGGGTSPAADGRAAPALFVSHGSPQGALDYDEAARALAAFGTRLSPAAVVILSAHWETRGAVHVESSPAPPLVYDFSGFPEALYRLRYPAPGDPTLAAEIVERLRDAGLAARSDATRGLDHGAWIPLRFAFPEARVPVVGLSLPVPRAPDDVTRMGVALAPLRRRGVLLVGSGGVVHNLRRLRFDMKDAPVEPWARDFDAWVWERVQALDGEGLRGYAERAPGARLAVPTTEHFDPLFFTLGAALEGDRPEGLHDRIVHGSLSLRTFSLLPG